MAERFKIIHGHGKRRGDTDWSIYDSGSGQFVGRNLTESQAEQVKKALDEATKEYGKCGNCELDAVDPDTERCTECDTDHSGKQEE